MLVAVYSPHGTYDAKFLANYAYINLADPVLRSPGIGNVQVFGAGQYAMRLWVKPDTLAKLGITVPEIVSAIQAQNTVNPAGKAGGSLLRKARNLLTRFWRKDDWCRRKNSATSSFAKLLMAGSCGCAMWLASNWAHRTIALPGRFNGKPSAVIAVYQLPGSNAVDAAAGVKKLMAQMKQRFPEDLDFVVALDTTRSVTQGIKEIIVTLFIALALVILVVYLFLQGWRATLIPLLAVPVSLVGTFVLFPLFGFSINTLSLFGLVLAIGLVVDDAIVVVEGVERHIEEGMTPKNAALKAMEELSGPCCGYRSGPFRCIRADRFHSRNHRADSISNSRSRSPSRSCSPHSTLLRSARRLAALLLRPKQASRGLLRRFFDWFNRVFERATDGYVRWSGVLLQKTAVVVVLLAGLWRCGRILRQSRAVELPAGRRSGLCLRERAIAQRRVAGTHDSRRAEWKNILMNTPGVEYTTGFIGFSLLSFVRTSYNATFFVHLQAMGRAQNQSRAISSSQGAFEPADLANCRRQSSFGFSPPAIPGVGTAGGFTFILEDRSGGDIQFLRKNLNTFLEAARKRPEIGSLSTTFLPSVPQKFVDVDRDKVLKQGVNLNDVYRTIQAFMGGYFINYFNRFGRQWQVYIEAESEDRASAENVGQFYVRNDKGENVPLSTLTTVKPRLGPEFTLRFNEYRSAQINGSAAPGYSADQATAALEDVFKQTMPREMGFDYSGISFPGTESPGRRAAFGHLRPFAIVCLLDSGGTVRKLVAAFQRTAQYAGRGLWSFCRALAAPRHPRRTFCRLIWFRSKATSIRKLAWSC